MKLTITQLQDFILFMEKLEKEAVQSNIVVIDIQSLPKESWWQASLIKPLAFETSVGSLASIDKIDLRSYILYLYEMEATYFLDEALTVQSLAWWQMNQSPQKRQEDSLSFSARVEEARQARPAYEKARKIILDARSKINRTPHWFSAGAPHKETAVAIDASAISKLSELGASQIVGALENIHVQSYMVEHLSNINLILQPNEAEASTQDDLTFLSDSDFWKTFLNTQHLSSMRWVKLIGFQISDWFPRTPGLYHTKAAGSYRASNNIYLRNVDEAQFYTPAGKSRLLKGGIGTIRFKPIRVSSISDEEHWLCTATSDGYVHSGIPLAIPNGLMGQIDFEANFTIVGQVKFLPNVLEPYFSHMTRIPQIYLLVDTLQRMSKEAEMPYITPMVFFASDWDEAREEGVPGFTSFVICRGASVSELDDAAEWLFQYAKRYKGEITTNYDQQRPTFEDAPFSLQNLMAGNVDRERLKSLKIFHAEIICDTIEKVHVESINMSKNEIRIGDGAVIHGDVVAAGMIQNSFNKIASADISDELKELLKKLAMEVGKLNEVLPKDNAQQVARDLDTLTAEITSKSPRKELWQFTADSLKKAAMNVGEIGKPILELLAQIVPLLIAISP